MVDTRIKIARDKAELVKALKDSEGTNAPFQTYADIVAFAAALGAKRNLRAPILEYSRKDPDPIPHEHFISRHYSALIDLIAVVETQSPKILTENEIVVQNKVLIFEEFANAGLEIIQNNLHGSVDNLERVMLMLLQEKHDIETYNSEFNLDSLI